MSAAAKVLFAQNAATLKLFRLSGPAPAARETHELTVATVLIEAPLADTTRLHLRLAVPQANQQARVGRIEAGGRLGTYVVLTLALSELDVEALELGPAGQTLLVANDGASPVRVEITVLA